MVKWDDTLSKRLLLAVIHLQGGKAPNWNQISAIMGHGVSASAAMQQYTKLKKQCGEEFGEVGGESTPAAKGKRSKGEKSGGKRKKSHEEVEGDDEEEEEEEEENEMLVKKVKVESEDGDESFSTAKMKKPSVLEAGKTEESEEEA